MDAGDWIALAAAVFAAAAVVFAGLSWHQSRRSADASMRSAAASERSAESAERSALAEERAANIAEREEQDRQAPSLSYVAKGRTKDAAVVATLTYGPPELDVRTNGLWIKSEQGDWVGSAFNSDPTRLSVHGEYTVPVDLRSESRAVEVKIRLECTEVHSDRPRIWERTGVVSFRGPSRVTVLR